MTSLELKIRCIFDSMTSSITLHTIKYDQPVFSAWKGTIVLHILNGRSCPSHHSCSLVKCHFRNSEKSSLLHLVSSSPLHPSLTNTLLILHVLWLSYYIFLYCSTIQVGRKCITQISLISLYKF